MGVDTLWMMPIFPIGSKKRKGSLGSYYSIKDFKDVNPEFGNRDDFLKLVMTAHELGMRVIIDWVANHAAWDNVWTIEHPDYFEHDEHGEFKPPYDWDDVIQIDHKNPAQQAAMLDAMRFWVVNFSIDGFRADLAHLTPLAFWINARKELDQVKKGLTWLAETEDENYFAAFDINYGWKWMHFSEQFFKEGLPAEDMAKFLRDASQRLPRAKWELYFTSNHDENSWNGTEYEKYGVYAKAMAVIAATQPAAIPLIYSGQEIPNTKRLKFFEKDTMEWQAAPTLQNFYSVLFSIRKSIATNGAIEYFTDGMILWYRVASPATEFLVLMNVGRSVVQQDITVTGTRGSYREIFKGTELEISGKLKVNLEPGEFLLFEKSR